MKTKPVNRKSQIANRKFVCGFTLVELLVVIAVIALLAAMLMPVIGSVMKHSITQRAQSERDQIETAIEGYKARYGFYPPSSGSGPLTNQLYYELMGTTMVVTNTGTNFITLDNSSTISGGLVGTYFSVGGIMNCTQGSGEDTHTAQSFLTNIKSGQVATNGDGVYLLATAAASDPIYHPLPGFTSTSGTANPWRYLCPGTNNPNSYDLWVQVVISGKTNLICNWASSPQINTSLP